MELLKELKEKEYREYINEHKLNVQKAWNIMKNNNKIMKYIENVIDEDIVHNAFSSTIIMLDTNIFIHDDSKYSKEEFDAYRKRFFPISEEEKDNCKEEFDKAWEHHYTYNLHHWNGWYKNGYPDRMQLIYVVEMICDWEAMGYKFGNTAKEFYYKNKDNIHLGEKQTKWVKDILELM